MRSLTTALLVSVLLGGCSNLQQQAQDSLLSTLPDRRGVTYDKVRTYPGDVVCGEYTASSVMGYTQRTLPFIYHQGRVFNRPGKDDVAIYCTREPVKALHERLGIGPMTSDNDALQQIYRDTSALHDALEAYVGARGDLPVDATGLNALTPPEGDYLQDIPLDPWGRPYHYERSLGGRVRASYELYTLGEDNAPGGTGSDADIRREHLGYLKRIASMQKSD
ncbi:MAG: type II secretion system protein GspG [Chromatocurvus sp.]